MLWKKVLVAALALAVISQVVQAIGAIADMGHYAFPACFSLWSPFVAGATNPSGVNFYFLSILFSLISGAISAYVYFFLKPTMKAKSYLVNGAIFGLFLFLLAGVTGTLSMYLMQSCSPWMIASWMAECLATFLVFGVALAKIDTVKCEK